MEIRRVQYFRTVVEAGGVVRAGEVLGVTAGTLSKSIRALEDELGTTLFVRSGRRLALTEQGTTFYRESQRLIDEHARVLRALDPQPGAGTALTIASFEVFTTHFLGALTDALAEHLEGPELRVLDVAVPTIEEHVRRRDADAGITYVPQPHRELRHRRVGRIEFGIYGRPGAFAATPFEDVPFAIPTSTVTHAPLDILGIDCWPYQRIPRRVHYRVTCLESALELARRGRCVTFIPTFIANAHNRTVRRASRLERRSGPAALRPVRQSVHVVTRESDGDAAELAELVAAVRHTLAELSAPS